MALSKITKTEATDVLGIDASTKAIAYCLFRDGQPFQWGIYNLNGADIYERIRDAKEKTEAILDAMDPDYVAIESAVFVNSPDAAIKLAYVYGATMAALMTEDTKVIAVTPQQWQNFIGNKNFSKVEKDALIKDNPGKSASWYSNKRRLIRKQRTLDYFNDRYDLELDDDNVGDAFGLAFYAVNKLTRTK